MNRTVKNTASLSFILGSCIFIWFYFTNSELSIIVGVIYVIFAALVNIVVVFITFLNYWRKKLNLNSYLKKSWLLFLNIPIAILYAYFVMYLLNTERLTIINETGHELTNVQISGCEQRTIGSLDLSEKVSLWVPIKQGGCYIKLSYYQEGELEEEIISFYKSGLDGQIRTFRIGVEEFIFMH